MAWEDATIRPYIPSDFGVCVFVGDPEHQLEDLAAPLNEKLSMLPVEAAELLRGREPVPFSEDQPPAEPPFDCLGVPLDEARLLERRAAHGEAGAGRGEPLPCSSTTSTSMGTVPGQGS